MKIDLSKLLGKSGQIADLDREVRLNLEEAGLVLTRPVRVKAELTNLGPTVTLKGSAETEIEVDCSRCGRRFKTALTAELDEEYASHLPQPEYKKGAEVELTDQDFVLPLPRDNKLDLGEVLRQNLLLAVPAQTICEENCTGPQ
ncbi:MAG: DUF177 domain-containing protein [Candidatus Margulisiibacteriota bacterium]